MKIQIKISYKPGKKDDCKIIDKRIKNLMKLISAEFIGQGYDYTIDERDIEYEIIV